MRVIPPQAKYCCAQCPRPHGVDRDLSLCEVCCQSIHKQKINKLHGYKEIPAPENKKCKVTPKTVKTWVQVEMQRAEYEDEELEDVRAPPDLRVCPFIVALATHEGVRG